MAELVALQLPIPWSSLGFPPIPQLGSMVLLDGDDPAWGWEGAAPALGIAAVSPVPGDVVTGWTVDHVVLLTPDLGETKVAMADVGAEPRLTMEVKGRSTAFFRVGTVLEVIASPVRDTVIYGVALAAEEPLETVALRWRSSGFDVTVPEPAIQPGRRIMSVRGLNAGLAVMSTDRAV